MQMVEVRVGIMRQMFDFILKINIYWKRSKNNLKYNSREDEGSNIDLKNYQLPIFCVKNNVDSINFIRIV